MDRGWPVGGGGEGQCCRPPGRRDSPLRFRVYEVATGREISKSGRRIREQVGASPSARTGVARRGHSEEGRRAIWDAANGKQRFAPLRSLGACLDFDFKSGRSQARGQTVRTIGTDWDAGTGNDGYWSPDFPAEQGSGIGFPLAFVFSPEGKLLAANRWGRLLDRLGCRRAAPKAASPR